MEVSSCNIEIKASPSYAGALVLPEHDEGNRSFRRSNDGNNTYIRKGLVRKNDIDEDEMSRLLASTPVFNKSDVKNGKVLGAGAFCRVCAVNDILRSASSIAHKEEKIEESVEDSIRDMKKEYMIVHFEELRESASMSSSTRSARSAISATNSMLSSSSRGSHRGASKPQYAIKFLKSTLDKADMNRGRDDLEKELIMLVKSSGHENIITLHGYGDNVYHAKSISSKFFILDRLKKTLKEKIKVWKDKRGLGIAESFAINKKRNKDLWMERMMHMLQISSAMSHIHSRGIIYRDLKPDNIGFDYNNVPKIFDFGLARTLDQSILVESEKTNNCDDCCYKMTAMTGSARYMCPEISLCKPYSLKADVYSYAIVMHEVLSLKLPFDHIHDIESLQLFVNDRGLRLPLPYAWQSPLKIFFKNMWDKDPRKRPSFLEIELKIHDLMVGNEGEFYPAWGSLKAFGMK